MRGLKWQIGLVLWFSFVVFLLFHEYSRGIFHFFLFVTKLPFTNLGSFQLWNIRKLFIRNLHNFLYKKGKWKSIWKSLFSLFSAIWVVMFCDKMRKNDSLMSDDHLRWMYYRLVLFGKLKLIFDYSWIIQNSDAWKLFLHFQNSWSNELTIILPYNKCDKEN